MGINPVFARRLYLCWLISHSERPNVPRLMALTGWPRRTLQDVLKALPGMGV
ncbi:helix-turn-helix domain-containing protein, partial [Serratia marcescens]|nr:helix-turn-helix domain-containing protein [Serratia marcescens]